MGSGDSESGFMWIGGERQEGSGMLTKMRGKKSP